MNKFENKEELERFYSLTKNTLKRVEDILNVEGDLEEEKRKEALKIIMEFEYVLEEVKDGRF